MDTLSHHLKSFGRVRPNTPLAKYSSFRLGGPAQFLVEVSETDKLVALLNFLAGEGIEWFILGGGTNVLFPDEGWQGAVIKIEDSRLKIKNSVIEASAGALLSAVVEASIREGLIGFEWAAGIPGTVGGAVRGNAGARYAFTGGELKDVIQTVSVWRDGEVVELTSAECQFGYRDSIFKHNKKDVILGMTIGLQPGNKAESLQMTQKIIAERRGKQPPEPSAGSFFKNVRLAAWTQDPGELPARFKEYQKIAAGWLIEQAELKGYRVGQAIISPSHANFIVNLGGATQADILAIVEEVKDRVYNKFGIELEEEVQIVE